MTKSYNLYDTQGNLAQIINARNGVILGKSAVSAWGEPIRDANGNAAGAGYGAKFGYVRDGESGFYLCTLRYYDASGGRWLTRDPIGYAGGSNLYGYVGNDPVNATDPSGLVPEMTTTGKQVSWYYLGGGKFYDMNKMDPAGVESYFNHPSFISQKLDWRFLLEKEIQKGFKKLRKGCKTAQLPWYYYYKGETDVTYDKNLFAIGGSLPYVKYTVMYLWHPATKTYWASISASYTLRDRFEKPLEYKRKGYKGELWLGTPYDFSASSGEAIYIKEKR